MKEDLSKVKKKIEQNSSQNCTEKSKIVELENKDEEEDENSYRFVNHLRIIQIVQDY